MQLIVREKYLLARHLIMHINLATNFITSVAQPTFCNGLVRKISSKHTVKSPLTYYAQNKKNSLELKLYILPTLQVRLGS